MKIIIFQHRIENLTNNYIDKNKIIKIRISLRISHKLQVRNMYKKHIFNMIHVSYNK